MKLRCPMWSLAISASSKPLTPGFESLPLDQAKPEGQKLSRQHNECCCCADICRLVRLSVGGFPTIPFANSLRFRTRVSAYANQCVGA
jgi:hypothetical protein